MATAARKLLAQYPGPTVIRYQCANYILDREASCCVSFGGLRADRVVAEQVLECLKPLGIQAAMQAIENLQGAEDERVHQKELALQQARYEAARAQRHYEAVDPLNRLVAAELERRWNEALKYQAQLETDFVALQRERSAPFSDATSAQLLALGEDVRRLWDHPRQSARVEEAYPAHRAQGDYRRSEADTVRLVLHWQGGDHTELTLAKTRIGQHRYVTDTDAIELIRSLARIQPDAMIASILNRIGRRTAHGQSWNARRVCSVRHNHAIEVYREGERQARGEVSVSEAAGMLGVTETTVLRMIRQKHLPATHACLNAPWILLKEDVEKQMAASRRAESRQTRNPNQSVLDIQ